MIVKWETAFNGDAVRIKHYINQKELIGESIIMFDQLENRFSRWYFSSGGISNKSEFLIENNKITFVEDVSKNNNSITKIRISYEYHKKDEYYEITKYLINSVWIKGSKVLFKKV